MATRKSVESQSVESPEETPEEAAPESTEFKAHMNDGIPTQDDLNPAYAAPKDEGAE